MNKLYELEESLHQEGFEYIAGTDEVGRGPMAGPVVAAAVVLPRGLEIQGLNDSKKLTEKMREAIYDEILEKAIDVRVCFISVEEVDAINVLEASRKAMTTCVNNLETKVDFVLTDAMKLAVDLPVMDIIKGDSKSASIAAASIVAKVARDRYMVELDKEFPMYGFKYHKGYVTKAHKEALEKFGVSKHHRKSFAPVQQYL